MKQERDIKFWKKINKVVSNEVIRGLENGRVNKNLESITRSPIYNFIKIIDSLSEEFDLSEEAQRDLARNYIYNIGSYGDKKTAKILMEYFLIFKALSMRPEIGDDASRYWSDLLRFKQKPFQIFYKKSKNGIFIVRIIRCLIPEENSF